MTTSMSSLNNRLPSDLPSIQQHSAYGWIKGSALVVAFTAIAIVFTSRVYPSIGFRVAALSTSVYFVVESQVESLTLNAVRSHLNAVNDIWTSDLDDRAKAPPVLDNPFFKTRCIIQGITLLALTILPAIPLSRRAYVGTGSMITVLGVFLSRCLTDLDRASFELRRYKRSYITSVDDDKQSKKQDNYYQLILENQRNQLQLEAQKNARCRAEKRKKLNETAEQAVKEHQEALVKLDTLRAVRRTEHNQTMERLKAERDRKMEQREAERAELDAKIAAAIAKRAGSSGVGDNPSTLDLG